MGVLIVIRLEIEAWVIGQCGTKKEQKGLGRSGKRCGAAGFCGSYVY
jgi:hypothetical protein